MGVALAAGTGGIACTAGASDTTTDSETSESPHEHDAGPGRDGAKHDATKHDAGVADAGWQPTK